jgi:hypothetical protein
MDAEEYLVEAIVAHRLDDDEWIPYWEVRELEALSRPQKPSGIGSFAQIRGFFVYVLCSSVVPGSGQDHKSSVRLATGELEVGGIRCRSFSEKAEGQREGLVNLFSQSSNESKVQQSDPRGERTRENHR